MQHKRPSGAPRAREPSPGRRCGGLKPRHPAWDRPLGAGADCVGDEAGATSVGFVPTRTPCASSASFLASAVLDEMMAPAWPIVLPGGAVKPRATGHDRRRHVLADELGRLLLLGAADLADHDGKLRLRIGLELSQDVDEGRATGSPPIPTIVDWPTPSWVSSCPIW